MIHFKHDETCPVYGLNINLRDDEPCKYTGLFLKESMGIKYCEQYNIKENSPYYEMVINAFCVGYGFGADATYNKALQDAVESIEEMKLCTRDTIWDVQSMCSCAVRSLKKGEG